MKHNKYLFIAGVALLVYGVCESIDSVVILLIVVKAIPNLSVILRFDIPFIQHILENRMVVLAPLFWTFAFLRLVSAVGLLKNRLWGFWIGIVNLVLSMILAVLFLPFGGIEFIVCGVILVFLIVGYCGKRPVVPDGS